MCFLLSDMLACRTCLARLSAFVLRNVAACLDYDCQMPKDFQKGAYLTQGIQPIQLLNSLELSAYRHTSHTPRKPSQTSFQHKSVPQAKSQAKQRRLAERTSSAIESFSVGLGRQSQNCFTPTLKPQLCAFF
uniref:Putative secreted protein n=1 Tax=Ixodes ricinus TaxID=34613 RepID=A0A6B0UR86_IXORI